MKSKVNFIREYSSDITIKIAKKVIESVNTHTGAKRLSSNLKGVVNEGTIDDEKIISYFQVNLTPELNKFIEDYFSYTNLLDGESFNFSHFSLMHLKKGFNIPFHYDSEFVYENDGEDEVRNFAVLLYLNNIEEGGELVFPVQETTVKPIQGKVLIFPTSFMFPHTTIPALNEDRYVLRMNYYFKKEIIKESIKQERSY